MISHHPDSNLLVEFANGSCDWALGILINTHLQHCRHCRSQVQQLEQLGSALLTAGPKVSVDDACLEKLLRRIDETPATAAAVETKTSQTPGLPPVVQRLIKPGARWQKISKHLKQQRLKTGQNKYEVALQSIKSGGQVSRHDHRGLEYTVVLQGSFSDAEGIYCTGDFVLRQPGQAHKPTASQNEDCLCLTAVEQPVRLTHWLGRMLNPFLRIH
ncbi:MAG TPA: ChrR family anti-sigma-E factor, partial [Cellvibrionaceae bacterium]|nr:ChrR family anti-sigma-E factor [Cellvibrionaceae bacterium]